MLDRFCLQIWIEEKKEEFTMFENYLVKMNSVELKKFVKHFFSVQQKLRMNPLLEGAIPLPAANLSNASLRGQEKLLKISYTFGELFLSLSKNESFFEEIKNYRILNEMFTKNGMLYGL